MDYSEDGRETTEDGSKVQNEEIQEGELVSSDSQVSNVASDSSATVLENLESLIRENLSRIDKLQEEARQHKEMIDSVLLNDEVYKQHDEAAKQAQKTKTATKSEILKRPDVVQIAEKLKTARSEIKEIRESMSSYLQEYRRLSGSAEIENDRGEIMEIIYVAKLVKRRT